MKKLNLPHMNYLNFLFKYRVVLLTLISLIILFLGSQIKNSFIYNDESLWLNGSTEYIKLLKKDYDSLYVNKVNIDISQEPLTLKSIEKLKSIHLSLQALPLISAVDSIFMEQNLVQNVISYEQSMNEIVSLLNQPNHVVLELLKSRELSSLTFYALSTERVDISGIDYHYPHIIMTSDKNKTEFRDFLLFSILFVILIISFTIAFKSFLPSLLSFIFILGTTIITVYMFQVISNTTVTHISIILLAVTVSVMDFIYIYYKWHVLQRRTGRSVLLLYRVVTKTVVPIFWTSVITIVGIGSLMFVDSQILHSIGLNVALSSFSGFILSFTLLPILLSFFKQEDPQIITKNSSRFFANKEAHYHKKGFILFLFLTLGVFTYNLLSYLNNPILVNSCKESNQIHLVLNDAGLNEQNLLELQNIQNLLKDKFYQIESFHSAYTILKKLHNQEHPNEIFNLSNIDMDAYQFMFDLYGISDEVMIDDHPTLTIYLSDHIQKSDILKFIQNEEFVIRDRSSLLDIAKVESINTLFYTVAFVMLLIMSVIYYMTRIYEFVWIALIVNTIPLIWFFAAIITFNIPLSTEILVAMIIAVALSSDATLHFIFYYHNNRHKARDSVLTLENSFIYIGTPLGLGNIILALTFFTLIFVPDSTISNIGIFSSILIILSLLSDLFILPVMFLNRVKNNLQIKGYYHEKE